MEKINQNLKVSRCHPLPPTPSSASSRFPTNIGGVASLLFVLFILLLFRTYMFLLRFLDFPVFSLFFLTSTLCIFLSVSGPVICNIFSPFSQRLSLCYVCSEHSERCYLIWFTWLALRQGQNVKSLIYGNCFVKDRSNMALLKYGCKSSVFSTSRLRSPASTKSR